MYLLEVISGKWEGPMPDGNDSRPPQLVTADRMIVVEYLFIVKKTLAMRKLKRYAKCIRYVSEYEQ